MTALASLRSWSIASSSPIARVWQMTVSRWSKSEQCFQNPGLHGRANHSRSRRQGLMSGIFFDTSALVKHYHTEVGSDEVDRLWNDPANSLFVSRLSAPEIVSAFAGKVRTRKPVTPSKLSTPNVRNNQHL